MRAGRPTGEAYVQLLAAKHERRLLGKQPVGAHSGLQLGMRRAPTASVTRSSASQLRAEPRELVRVERTASRGLSRMVARAPLGFLSDILYVAVMSSTPQGVARQRCTLLPPRGIKPLGAAPSLFSFSSFPFPLFFLSSRAAVSKRSVT